MVATRVGSNAAVGVRWKTLLRSAKLPGRQHQRLRLVCAAGNGSNPVSTKVKFSVTRHVEFGQTVSVVGGAPEVGNWQVESSVPLTWQEGDIWTCEAEVTVGDLEYKYIVEDDTGSLVEWLPGDNLEVSVKQGETNVVTDDWAPVPETTQDSEVVESPEALEESTLTQIPVEETAAEVAMVAEEVDAVPPVDLSGDMNESMDSGVKEEEEEVAGAEVEAEAEAEAEAEEEIIAMKEKDEPVKIAT